MTYIWCSIFPKNNKTRIASEAFDLWILVNSFAKFPSRSHHRNQYGHMNDGHCNTLGPRFSPKLELRCDFNPSSSIIIYHHLSLIGTNNITYISTQHPTILIYVQSSPLHSDFTYLHSPPFMAMAQTGGATCMVPTSVPTGLDDVERGGVASLKSWSESGSCGWEEDPSRNDGKTNVTGWPLVENEGMKLYMDIVGIHSLIPY